MLNFLALMIAFGMLLWLIASVVVFTGGLAYYFFKDTTGEILGVYRKTHIPDGMPYAEKFYFTPGDSGFKVWDTAYCL